MRSFRIDYGRLTEVLSGAVLILFVLPVMAEGADRSMEQFTQATQTWGQAFIVQQAAQRQQALAMEITLGYETQLAQQTSVAMDEAVLEKMIEAVTPSIISRPTEAIVIDKITCRPDKTQC